MTSSSVTDVSTSIHTAIWTTCVRKLHYRAGACSFMALLCVGSHGTSFVHETIVQEFLTLRLTQWQ